MTIFLIIFLMISFRPKKGKFHFFSQVTWFMLFSFAVLNFSSFQDVPSPARKAYTQSTLCAIAPHSLLSPQWNAVRPPVSCEAERCSDVCEESGESSQLQRSRRLANQPREPSETDKITAFLCREAKKKNGEKQSENRTDFSPGLDRSPLPLLQRSSACPRWRLRVLRIYGAQRYRTRNRRIREQRSPRHHLWCDECGLLPSSCRSLCSTFPVSK